MRITSFAVASAFMVLAAAAFAQTDTPKGYTGAYTPAPAPGAAPNSPVGGTLPELDTGPGLDKVGPDGVSTKTVRAVPCSTSAQETDGTTTCVGIPEGGAKTNDRR